LFAGHPLDNHSDVTHTAVAGSDSSIRRAFKRGTTKSYVYT